MSCVPKLSYSPLIATDSDGCAINSFRDASATLPLPTVATKYFSWRSVKEDDIGLSADDCSHHLIGYGAPYRKHASSPFSKIFCIGENWRAHWKTMFSSML